MHQPQNNPRPRRPMALKFDELPDDALVPINIVMDVTGRRTTSVYDGKRPTLQELHFHLFKRYFDDAHTAMADVLACKDCFFELANRGVILTDGQVSAGNEEFDDSPLPPSHANYIFRETANTKIKVADPYEGDIEKLKREVEVLRNENDALQEKLDDLNTETGVLELISGFDNEWQKIAAGHKKCPVKILAKLVDIAFDSYDADLAAIIAKNPATPSSMIRFILDVGDFYEDDVVAAVANNPNSDSRLLAYIKLNCDNCHLDSIESNPSYKENEFLELLTEYADSEDEFKRCLVAEHVRCPEDFLEKLSIDTEKQVRLAVAENSATPGRLLMFLMEDREIEVSAAAERNPNNPVESTFHILDDALAKNDLYAVIKIASDPHTPKPVLDWISELEQYEYRVEAALNPSTPQEAKDRLANDPEIRVRIAAKKGLRV